LEVTSTSHEATSPLGLVLIELHKGEGDAAATHDPDHDGGTTATAGDAEVDTPGRSENLQEAGALSTLEQPNPAE
jgi:hypothetical protein